MKKNLKHLNASVSHAPESSPYASPSKGRKLGSRNLSDEERKAHADALVKEYENLSEKNPNFRHITFISLEKHPFNLPNTNQFQQSTIRRKQKRKEVDGVKYIEQVVSIRTIFRNDFFRKLKQYHQSIIESSDNIKHKNLFDNLLQIERDLEPAFWDDDPKYIPKNTETWCEVWLSRKQEFNKARAVDKVYEEAKELALKHNISISNSRLSFPEHIVVLMKIDRQKMSIIIREFLNIYCFKHYKDRLSEVLSFSKESQAELIEDISSRIDIETPMSPICIYDYGINAGHPLIAPFCPESNRLTIMNEWGTFDENGHGTAMAGICLYGDSLLSLIQGTNEIKTCPTIISIKVNKNTTQDNSNPSLYGDFLLRGVAIGDILLAKSNQNSSCHVSALTAGESDGSPTSYSASIDQAAFGTDSGGETKRLFLLSAGNNRRDISPGEEFSPEKHLSSIEDPAQSWNALTIGAYTAISASFEDSNGRPAFTTAGSLGVSPVSTSSTSWGAPWPRKPDCLFEGGNTSVHQGSITVSDEPDTGKLSLSHDFNDAGYFAAFSGTSLASALAAHLVSSLFTIYPNLWPETIRGMVVHAAEWDVNILNQVGLTTFKDLFKRTNKSVVKELARVAGNGVVNFEKARYSQPNDFVVFAEQYIQPYQGDSFYEVHFYKLPWPIQSLKLLMSGGVELKVKITLSYFIDPSPNTFNARSKYSYASYNLGFDVISSTENSDDFKRRVNRTLRNNDQQKYRNDDSSFWLKGKNERTKGSLQSDIWIGSASDLITLNEIAVYPIDGWRKRSEKGRWKKEWSRYSLLVSIEVLGDLPSTELDMYNEVLSQIEVQSPPIVTRL